MSPSEIAFSHTLRGKSWSWVELYTLTKILPSELIKDLENDALDTVVPTDPFWLFTQSAKNYQTDTQKLLSSYSDPNIFKITSNNYGIGTHFSYPDWTTIVYNSNWYWHHLKAQRFAQIISLIPGVKKIYLVGSGSLAIARDNSDIDYAIECFPTCCLLVRLYLKIVLKITAQDVHSFFQKSRTKSGKVDVGLFFKNRNQISKFHHLEARQLSLVMIKELPTNHIFQTVFTIVFLPLHFVFWIISLIQLPYYYFQLKGNKNLIVSHNFISFLPRFYADGKFRQQPK